MDRVGREVASADRVKAQEGSSRSSTDRPIADERFADEEDGDDEPDRQRADVAPHEDASKMQVWAHLQKTIGVASTLGAWSAFFAQQTKQC